LPRIRTRRAPWGRWSCACSPGQDSRFPSRTRWRRSRPRTRLVFLNTPNNPTGQLIALGDLERIAAAAPHAVVVIDEAYIEFGGTSFLPRLAAWPNVIVGRTFSKAYGLAGMRVGVLIGQPAVLDPVRAVHAPLQHQRGGAGRRERRARGPRLPAALRRRRAPVARAYLRRV
jgi:hypothetical protein